MENPYCFGKINGAHKFTQISTKELTRKWRMFGIIGDIGDEESLCLGKVMQQRLSKNRIYIICWPKLDLQ